jgi:hypothetical protein
MVRAVSPCRPVKVKRLFLYMAENQELPWLTKVALSKADLGKGKRMVVPKGRYDSKYQITVPVDREGITA